MSDVAHALFAVPAFPRARPFPVVQRSSGAVADLTAAQLIAAIRKSGMLSPRQSGSTDGDDPRQLLAALAGDMVQCGAGRFGALSDLPPGSAEHATVLEALVETYLLRDVSYHSPFTGAALALDKLIALFADWHAMLAVNRTITAAFGFAQWKRDTVDPMLWGGEAAVPFRTAHAAALDTLPDNAVVAVWKARIAPALLQRLEAGPWRLLEVEDGFIRSVGLGADCVPPLSIVVDDMGAHYDPTQPNRLEHMLATAEFTADDLARASELRRWIVREGVSKYGVGAASALARPGREAQRHILVVGQVEDDRSVLCGGGDVQSNLDLLRRVRIAAPGAFIIYRPHPDVMAGHRKGAIAEAELTPLADMVDAHSSIGTLIGAVDEVHVITSLAGFEALLQGTTVVTHGVPFYAGWGLTQDRGNVPDRRGKRRTLDELVAAVLLQYPRYLDPVTNLPCPPEILVMRLLAGVTRQNKALVPLRQLVGRVRRRATDMAGSR